MIKKYGQSILEFAVVIACILAALVAMQVYIKRGVQGRLRQAADEISQQHYSPRQTSAIDSSKPNMNMTLAQEKKIEIKKEHATQVEIGEIKYDGDYFKRKETMIKDETETTLQEKVE